MQIISKDHSFVFFTKNEKVFDWQVIETIEEREILQNYRNKPQYLPVENNSEDPELAEVQQDNFKNLK